MSTQLSNPRSVLHALAPIGVGTPGVESLLSYLCRLAVSHAVSVTELSRKIAKTAGWDLCDNYNWKRLHLSGNGEAARNWSSALSALTSVEQLDQLTLLPWADVVAQQSLTTMSARWCPQCFAEDRAAGRSPYLRLAWDVGCVTACQRHRTQLVHVCPDCGRADARHRFAYVVPGWCAHCGAFLGDAEHPMPATPEETWKGSQVGDMLAAQATLQAVPARESLHEGLRELVARVDHGKSAAFARRIGLSKGTVHHWLKEGGIPALPAHLRIASQTGLSLAKLLAGDLANWSPTTEVHQLTFLFPRLGERAARRELDWEQIRAELTAMGKLLVPVSVAEAARCLDVDVRLLYQSANKEARILAERWRQYMRRRGEQSVANAREAIDVACQDIASQGKSINLREVKERVRPEVIGKVRNVIGLVQGARERSEAG